PADRISLSRIWLCMKLTAFLLLAACLHVTAKGFSQVINLDLKNAPLEKVMNEIQRQSGYNFIYTKTDIAQARTVDVHLSNAGLDAALAACFRDQPVNYSVTGKFIVLKAKSSSPLTILYNLFHSDAPPGKLHGRIYNEQNLPMEGASIQIKGTRKGTQSGPNGEFELDGISPGMTLIVSYA